MLREEIGEGLWQAFLQHGDQQARETLIEQHAPLVKYMAGRLAVLTPPTIELDDLVGMGAVGLIQAVDRYDPDRGVKFSTYALSRIRGAILDGLRQLDWLPRTIREKERHLRETDQKLAQRLGRFPEDEELAQELGITPDQLHDLFQEVGQGAVLSFDEMLGSDPYGELTATRDQSVVVGKRGEPATEVLWNEVKGVLAATLDRLQERERLVVTLYYYEGLTLREIAVVLGVSQSRVSQLHSKAILRLRGMLGAKKRELLE